MFCGYYNPDFGIASTVAVLSRNVMLVSEAEIFVGTRSDFKIKELDLIMIYSLLAMSDSYEPGCVPIGFDIFIEADQPPATLIACGLVKAMNELCDKNLNTLASSDGSLTTAQQSVLFIKDLVGFFKDDPRISKYIKFLEMLAYYNFSSKGRLTLK